MFYGQVTYGTVDEFYKEYADELNDGWHKCRLRLHGNFNDSIDRQCGRRASFINVEIEVHRNENFDITEVSGIAYSRWGGTYWYTDWFSKKWNSEKLLPIRVDWNGKTYISRWESGKDEYWEQVPTFHY